MTDSQQESRIALLERALHQIKNGCVDDGDTANELFRSSPAEIRKIARDALDGVGDFAESSERPRELVVLSFPGHVSCRVCTQPLTSQPRKVGESHAICWCACSSCELYDVRLVLDAVQLPVRRFEG